MKCRGQDPACPCQDGDACHYVDVDDTRAMRSCRHSTRPDASASMCSQCLAAPVRRVSSAGPEMFIDGEPILRTVDAETNFARSYYGKRGGKALHGSRKR